MEPDPRPALVVDLRVRTVILELTCEDHYAAIELYEHLVASARQAGLVNVVVGGIIQARQGGD
jgi:hypothetical protein